MTDDFSTHAPKGKKKLISVTVGLRLGGDFKVRGQTEFHKAFDIDSEIYIKRTWGLSLDKTTIIDTYFFGNSLTSLVEATTEYTAAVIAHIRAVRFVYVPNHARPSELIRRELAPLRSNLVSRLRSTKAYKESSVDELFTEMTAMGHRMFGDVSKAVSRGLPGVGIEPDLPADFADLVFNVGVRARTGDVARAPEFEGSGAQSFLLLHVLNLADRTYRGAGFGWIQASVWAVEEPESFLHAGLRVRFSEDLRAYADDSIRQIFVTTHQDEFVRISDFAWLAKKEPDTVLHRMAARDALVESTKSSISSYAHPLFTFASEPIVIVEGRSDEIYLRAAIQEADIRPRWRLISPGAVLGDDYTGDAILNYLKFNKPVVASRPDIAPVIVLRDWEASDMQKYNNALAVHPFSKCLVPPSSITNPSLGETFVGIERFLPTDFITSVIPEQTLGRESGEEGAPYLINRPILEAAKSKLADRAESGAPVGPYMQNLATWIDDQITSILKGVPSSAFI